MPSRTDLVVEVKLDLRPFVEACRAVAAHFQALADALESSTPGLQKLARASDLTTAQRRGEKPCSGVHDALAPSGCPFCGAAL